MMCAGCYRRTGQTVLALQRYQEVHSAHPLNQEAMRFIAQLAAESGRRAVSCCLVSCSQGTAASWPYHHLHVYRNLETMACCVLVAIHAVHIIIIVSHVHAA